MKDVLHTILFTPLRHGRWGLPVVFMSPPGAGKTDILHDIAQSYKLPMVTLSPGTHGEGAFGVTPVPMEVFEDDVKKMAIGYPPPEYIKTLFGGGILYLNELSTAPPALQPPMLGMLQDRRVGFYEFPGRVRVLADSNPVSLSAGGYSFSAPVANRMGHYEWEAPTGTEWGSWLIGNGMGGYGGPVVDAAAEEARVLKAWPTEWAYCAGLTAGYAQARGEGALMQVPPEGSPALAGAWPSYRTFEYAVRAWASARIHKLDDVKREKLVASFIGTGARDSLFAYVEKVDLPDPAAVLDRTVKWAHEPARLDRTYAVLSSCTALVQGMSAKDAKRAPRADSLWEIFLDVRNGGAVDAVQPYATTIAASGLASSKVAERVLASLRDDLRAAKMGAVR